LIVGSTKDPASVNIGRCLLELYDFKRLPETFQGNPVYSISIGEKEVRYVRFFPLSRSIHPETLERRNLEVFLERSRSLQPVL